MKYYTSVLLTIACTISGCAANGPAIPLSDTEVSGVPDSSTQPSSTIAGDESFIDESTIEYGDKHFANSELIANDFLNVIQRVPEFVAGQTSFSASLPRTKYGEILMEQLRQSGFTIVLGQSSELPALSYQVELPSGDGRNMYTFFVSVGKMHLKRSYEIVGDRVAPVTEMLIAGIDTSRLRPLQPAQSSTVSATEFEPLRPLQSAQPSEELVTAPEPLPERIEEKVALAPTKAPPPLEPLPIEPDSSPIIGQGATDDIDASDLNAFLIEDEDWNPLDSNLYETEVTVYEPLFNDVSVEYQEISSQVLIFPNDSLVLGRQNKITLLDLASKLRSGTDIVRVIGCSHGKTDVVEGNQKLARGRAVRVRDELVLAGVENSSVLHEACWAPQHYDEVMPRRGVVVKHLRERD